MPSLVLKLLPASFLRGYPIPLPLLDAGYMSVRQLVFFFFFFSNMAFLLRNYTKESQPHFALAQIAITKHHKLGGLSTIEIYFSQFQSLEAYDEDASMIGSW